MSGIVSSVRVLISLIDRVTAPARAIMRSLDAIAAPARRAKLALQALMETRGLKRLMAGLGGIGNRVRSLAGMAAGLAAPIATIFSGGAIAGLLNAAHATSEYADNMMDAARSAGIGFEAFQALNHVAEQGGVSMESLSGAFNKLNKHIGAAKSGMPHAQEMFDALGVSASDLARLTPDETFLAVADALEKITDPSLKASAAMALFGKSGASLLPMMNGGAAAMKEMMDDAKRLGIVMDEESGKASAGFADNVARLMSAIQGLSRTIAAKIIPTLEPLVLQLTEWIAVNRELIATQLGAFVQRIAEWIQQIDFDRVLEGFNNFISGIQQAVDWVGGWGNAAILLGAGVTGLLGPLVSIASGIASALIPALWSAIPAVVSFGAALMTTPIGWVIAGVAALAAAVYLIYDNWGAISEWFSSLWQSIKTGFSAFVKWMIGAIEDLLNAWSAPLRVVAGLIGFEIPKFDFGGTASILASSNAPQDSSAGVSQLTQTQTQSPAKAQVGGEMVVRFENPPPGMEVVSSKSDSPALSFRPDLGQAFGFL